MTAEGYETESTEQSLSTATILSSPDVLHLFNGELFKRKRVSDPRDVGRSSTELPFAFVDGVPQSFKCHKVDNTEGVADGRASPLKYSGLFCRSTDEIVFDNRVRFCTSSKWIVALDSDGQQTRVSRCDISRPIDHFGDEPYVIEVSSETPSGIQSNFLAVSNNRDGSIRVWSKTQWSGTPHHSFRWTQPSSSPIAFPEIAPQDDSKPAAVEDKDSLLGRVLFPGVCPVQVADPDPSLDEASRVLIADVTYAYIPCRSPTHPKTFDI
jgi:hypothetical protein